VDTAIPQLRPMGVVDQLDAAFRLYRRNFVTFLGIVALVQAPLLILSLVYSVVFVLPAQEALFSQIRSPRAGYYGTSAASAQSPETTLLSLVLVVVGMLANMLIVGALSYAVSRAYLGNSTGILDAYRHVAHGRRLAGLIVCGLIVNSPLVVFQFGSALVTLAPAFACLACIVFPLALIAYLYLTLRLLTVPQVVVLEDRGPRDALARAWSLMHGHMLRALGLAVLVGLVIYVIPMGLQYVAAFALIFLPFSPTLVLGLGSGLVGIFQIAVLPILWGAYTLFYYDLRIRKEGYDLRVQADQLAAAVPPA
jgi:hypothetical protein